jgi:hypothetical protein
VFTVEERDRVRDRLLSLAEDDPDVAAAAITGSYAVGRSDEWSDVDLAFGIRSDVSSALARWTEIVDREFGVIHLWDLPAAATIYRVFLLPDWLQVDIAFTPAAEFGARGPNWRTVFGDTVEHDVPQPSPNEFIGWGWVLARHARVCIERARRWQALWCIDAVRDNAFALACLRLGYPTRFARAADDLPSELTTPAEGTLIRSLDEAELRRALSAVIDVFARELERNDGDLAAKLKPMLNEL